MPEITVAETDVRRVRDQIVDVREDEEVREGMIPGAIHIPLDSSPRKRESWTGSGR